jgi:hypothetical protein
MATAEALIPILNALQAPAPETGVWTSPTPHPFGNASCHPHCDPGKGDQYQWREQVPPNLKNFRVLILDGGDKAAQLEEYSVTEDATNLATVNYTHRTHAVVAYLQADQA